MESTTGKDKALYFKIFYHYFESRPMPTLANTKNAIWSNLLSIQNAAISLVAICSRELWLVHNDWSRKIALLSNLTRIASRRMKTYSESRIELWNPQNLKKILEKSSQFLPSEQSCEPKSLDVAFNIAEVENTLGKHAAVISNEGHSIRVLNERSVSDSGNLCTLWLRILKSVWHSVWHTLKPQYSWPRAVVSYTLLAAVSSNGLKHLRRKAMLCVYNWVEKWCFDVSFLTSIRLCKQFILRQKKSWIFKIS